MPNGDNGTRPDKNTVEIVLICTIMNGELVGMQLKNMPANLCTAFGILEWAKGIVLDAFLGSIHKEPLIAVPDMTKLPPLTQ